MKNDSAIDYLSCILFKLVGPFMRLVPLRFAFFLGKCLGALVYFIDVKHRAVAYANIKVALGDSLGVRSLRKATWNFYLAFGQNFIEIFLLPKADKGYINKYMAIEGREYIAGAFASGKGVIFLGMHEGSWEISNVLCASLGFPFSLFVRDQRLPRLSRLLNSYRLQKGCKIIQRQNQTRQLIEELKNNGSLGMSADQGGKSGRLVKFFGKTASMSSGAIRLGLKYDTAILTAFYTRIDGPYSKVILEPLEIKKTGDLQADIRDNLQAAVHIFEKHIRKYPQEYLWTYKIWKYGREKNILILSDGKTGHLRQAQTVADIAESVLKKKDIASVINTVEIKFKNKFSRYGFILTSCLSDKYSCQGCLRCLKIFLKEEAYKALLCSKPDIIISCGASLAAVNFLLARENLAKSVVIMKPTFLGARKFDLVIVPRHDAPPRRKNVVVTEGALNLIDDRYLREQSERLKQMSDVRCQMADGSIGLLIGGDTKNFRLNKDLMVEVIRQAKVAAGKLKADVLVTTSRRTSREIEDLVKNEFKDYPACQLLIIANEKNIPEAVGGILGLSSIVITSAESISMVSEAATSNRHVLVFNSSGLSRRHKIFLDYLSKKRYPRQRNSVTFSIKF